MSKSQYTAVIDLSHPSDSPNSQAHNYRSSNPNSTSNPLITPPLGHSELDRSANPITDRNFDPFDDSHATDYHPYRGPTTQFDVDDTNTKRDRHVSSGSLSSLLKGRALSGLSLEAPSLTTPWRHAPGHGSYTSTKGPSTIKSFNNRHQRYRVVVSSLLKWLRTVFLCGCATGCLIYFAHFDMLSDTKKYIFNTIVTGLLICMGLELQAALKSHARLLRWRFLASQYRTLQDFELVMNCEQVTTSMRLLWAGRSRGKWLPNKTQLLAFIWIVLNIAVQVFPATLGLTYSLETADDSLDEQFGLVSISNITDIEIPPNTPISVGQLRSGVANSYGRAGLYFGIEDDIPEDEQYFASTIYRHANESLYWHRFWDKNPYVTTRDIVTSTPRTVEVESKCQELVILQGGFSGFGENFNSSADTYGSFNLTFRDPGGVFQWVVAGQSANGALTWMSNFTGGFCGAGCAQTYVLLSAQHEFLPKPKLWQCNTTVSEILFSNGTYPNPQDYTMSDNAAFYFAGAIGWSGIVTENEPLQQVLYPPGNPFNTVPYEIRKIDSSDIASLIMMFSTMAIAAYDENGPRRNVTGFFPINAIHLSVQWPYAVAILAGIPAGMLLILFAVVSYASKTIIKDGSHLATAKLLRPIVDKLGDNGCLLTGDEIADQLGNYKIIYGVRTPGDRSTSREESMYGDQARRSYSNILGVIRHLDIIEEKEGMGYIHGRMPAGDYNGMSTSVDQEHNSVEKRR